MRQPGALGGGHACHQRAARIRCYERSYVIILGRPVNLWLGLTTTLGNLIVIGLAALVPPIIIPALVVGAANVAIAAVIAFIANQPPTVNAGDQVTVITPKGQPNLTKTV